MKIITGFLTALLMLISTGASAYNKIMDDVNTSCGYTVFSDCAGCHYGTGGLTPEQSLYLSNGACAFCTSVSSCSSTPPTADELLAAARQTTNNYFETLFKAFMQHMMATGMMNPDGSINDPNIFATVFPSCPDIAPVIASDFSRQTGYLVRRVTTRTRNSRNIPDEWEQAKLQDFERLAAKGSQRTQFDITKPDGSILPTREFEAYEVVKEGNDHEGIYFRYMRSITMPGLPTEPPYLPCLKCHGTFDQLGPGVADAILDEYPYDLAVGYKKGDIRGAWSIKIPLTQKPNVQTP